MKEGVLRLFIEFGIIPNTENGLRQKDTEECADNIVKLLSTGTAYGKTNQSGSLIDYLNKYLESNTEEQIEKDWSETAKYDGCKNKPCSPNIKHGYIYCLDCDWSE